MELISGVGFGWCVGDGGGGGCGVSGWGRGTLDSARVLAQRLCLSQLEKEGHAQNS